MTYHGTSRASLENAVSRAYRRELKIDKINAWHVKVRNHTFYSPAKTQARVQAREDNERLGLSYAPHRTPQQQMLHLHKTSKRKVTLPHQPAEPPCERTQAEQRMCEAIRQAIDLLSFHLTALTHIPNPRSNFHNRVRQQAVFDLVNALAHTVTPPLSTKFCEPVEKPRVPMTRTCVNCGGPACIEDRGHWYCEHCA